MRVNSTFSGLKGGSKRVKWKSIAKHPDWYISSTFLLPRKPFENPTRLSYANLRAYWEHWADLSLGGDVFTFKRTNPPHGHDDDGDSGEGDKEKTQHEDSEESEDSGLDSEKTGDKDSEDSEDSGVESEQPYKIQAHRRTKNRVPLVPAGCISVEEKHHFLQSLCPWSKDYQAVVEAVTQMVVCSFGLSFVSS